MIEPTEAGSRREDPAGQLWRLWRQGQRPDVRQFLAQCGELTPAQVAAVLRVDQCQRWQSGLRVPAESYFEFDPSLRADEERALDLVYGEFLLREELGERPTLQEFVQRFPHYAEQLRLQVELHRAVEAGGRIDPRLTTDTPPQAAPAPGGETVSSGCGDWPEVSGYEVLGELGRGGMGVIYKARQQGLGRLVAVKVLTSGQANPDQLARFRTEAESAARLQHPNIVQVFEVGAAQGRPFLALEFVDGGNLQQHLAGAPQPPRWSAQLVEVLARAMHFAHQQGILHRDLKPANVLLTPDGTAKITDFGLAKHLEAGGGQTQSGAILGTPAYMAPEQAGGHGGKVGPAVDVYALGAILYECLTGRPPFQAATMLETLELVRSSEALPPARLQPKLPRDLDTICLKCLHKEPRKRYATAHELAADLHRFLNHEPIRARRTGPLGRTWRWCRRKPAVAVLLGCVAVLAVVTVIVSAVSNWRLGVEAEQARRAQGEATDRLFDALRTRAEAGRGSGRAGQRFGSLESLRQAGEIARAQNRPPEELLKLRNEAIACLALPDVSLEQEWEGNPPGTSGLAFDAGLERYAWSFKDEGIRICRTADHHELLRLPTLPGDRVSRWLRCRFSLNGRYLAVYYQQWSLHQPLEVWDLQGGAGRPVVTLADACCQPVFAADGRSLLAGLPGGTVTVIDLPSGKQRCLLQRGWEAESLALHAGSRLLAVASLRPPGVQVRDLESGDVLQELRHPDSVQGVAWAPQGDLLAAACNDHQIYLWDGRTGQKRGVLNGHRWEVHDLAFDPTGRWLASFGWDMTLRLWEVGSGRQILNLEDVRILDFRTQGGLAAAGLFGQQARVWAFRPSPVYDALHCPDKMIYLMSFSPDGRWLTTCGPGAPLRLWDLAGCREAGHWPELGYALWGPEGTGFLTGGAGGFWRVPVQRLEGEPGVRVGPPRRLSGLSEDLRPYAFPWVGKNYRRLMMVRKDQPHVRVVEIEGETARELWNGRHPNVASVTASPDGRLLASGTMEGGNGVRVWEADTGRLVRELPIGDANPVFSADGRRLFTTTGRITPRGSECQAWRVASWEPEQALTLKRVSSSPATMNVAADGLLAVAYTMNDVRLLEPHTLAEVATLVDPEPGLIPAFSFSPDSSTLVVSHVGGIHLWDLRRLREELAALGLDWDRPPYPPASRAAPARIEFLPGRAAGGTPE
jgi:WD40 repeat protein/predicted Ser/Thr protein kinase